MHHTPAQSFPDKARTADIFLNGNEMNIHTHVFPNLNLVVKLGSRPSIKGRKTDDVN